MVLFGTEPRLDVLRDQIIERFRGRETTVGEVLEDVCRIQRLRSERHGYKRSGFSSH